MGALSRREGEQAGGMKEKKKRKSFVPTRACSKKQGLFFVVLSVNSHSMAGASDVEARVVNGVSEAEGGLRWEREGGVWVVASE